MKRGSSVSARVALRKYVSPLLFSLRNRPTVAPWVAKHRPSKALFVMSTDLEMAWAWRYSRRNEDPLAMARRERENVPILLNLFEEYNVPITWAVVGHLLLHSCRPIEHKWMRRIPYFENKNWIYDHGDWFDSDPHTDWRNTEEWYCPDLIEKIIRSKAGHELACHTFSHIDFSDKNCPPMVAEDEIKACRDVVRRWKVTTTSFVFAGGTYGNYETLFKCGFNAYRRALEYELSYPFKDAHGLVVIPSSVGLGDENVYWKAEYYVRRYKRYIDKAIEHNALCHFWFHPSMNPWFISNVLRDITDYIARLRDRNLILVRPMREIADLFLSGRI